MGGGGGGGIMKGRWWWWEAILQASQKRMSRYVNVSQLSFPDYDEVKLDVTWRSQSLESGRR